ncbi:chaperone protein HtpG [mine drainage metagenome]|uniref:Chaperone protein HtpG n=1 Tax=mine drainage metagenome TaxID=410659 RepID=A0A1J5QNN5_9ZZZZ
MDALTTRIQLTSMQKAPSRVTEEVAVGKDVLELFASAMYAEPLSTFREYVQNAADSLDQARESGVQPNPRADVLITFDHAARTVRIRDFGAGVPNAQFVRRLTTIGASQKRGTGARGFRGIGRLSGLGYCQELVFRSRALGDRKVKEMRWDGHVLRERLRDASFNGSLGDLIREVAHVAELPGAEFPANFFEVELNKVLRVHNDVLLNEDAVRRYLSEVAPVPFDPKFRFGDEIQEFLSSRGIPEPIRIILSDRPEPVYHRARNQFPVSPKVLDEFTGVTYFEHQNSDDEPLSFGWLLDHAYAGSIARSLGLGGVRLRHRNVQVGDAHALASLYTELRFALWAVGDVHVAHPRVIPNGRRDEFEQTPVYGQVIDELRGLTGMITRTIRQRSDLRTQLKRAYCQLAYAEAWLERAAAAQMPVLATSMVERASSHVGDARKALAKLGPDAPGADIARSQVERIANLATQQSKGRPTASMNDSVYVAVAAILASSSKPDAVLHLAEQVVRAMGTAARTSS